jgi:hypothetical protein
MAAVSGAEVGAAANGFGKGTTSEEGSLVRTAVWLVRTKKKTVRLEFGKKVPG